MNHNRHSVRLSNWDYSSSGCYFVTICTFERGCVFGEVSKRKMRLNDYGKIVNTMLNGFDKSNPYNFGTDTFQIMPNHIHVIFICRGVIYHAHHPKYHAQHHRHLEASKSYKHMGLINQTPTLGHIVRYFKAKTSFQLHKAGFNNIVWQRNYHEHIVRNEIELSKIREYIENNPAKWQFDKDNPRNWEIRS